MQFGPETTEAEIQSYVKRIFDLDVSVKIQAWIRGGYAAQAEYSTNKLIFSRSFLKHYYPQTIRETLWHEVGHIMSHKTKCPTKREVEAHMWSLKFARRKGFNKVYDDLVHHVYEWQELDPKRYIIYRRAAKQILREMKRCRLPDTWGKCLKSKAARGVSTKTTATSAKTTTRKNSGASSS